MSKRRRRLRRWRTGRTVRADDFSGAARGALEGASTCGCPRALDDLLELCETVAREFAFEIVAGVKHEEFLRVLTYLDAPVGVTTAV